VPRLLTWLTKTVEKIADPKREQRIRELAEEVERAMRTKKQAFDLEATLVALQAPRDDDELISKRVYEKALRQAWRDYVLTQKEMAGLRWVVSALRLTPEQEKAVSRSAAVDAFTQFLATATQDGHIDKAERERLDSIATHLGDTTPNVIRSFVTHRGASFLQSLFAAVVARGRLTPDAWATAVHNTRQLGLSEQELRIAVTKHSEHLVSQMLQHAQFADTISVQECDEMAWVIKTLQPPEPLSSIANRELARIRRKAEIVAGNLPSITSSAVQLRSGEVLHHVVGATFQKVRKLKNGDRIDEFSGQLFITNKRMMFVSPGHTHDLPHSKVGCIMPSTRGIELQALVQRASGWYQVHDEVDLTTTVYESAIKHNSKSKSPSRKKARRKAATGSITQGEDAPARTSKCSTCGSTKYVESHREPNGTTVSRCRDCSLKALDAEF
jgi:hypothetical protein